MIKEYIILVFFFNVFIYGEVLFLPDLKSFLLCADVMADRLNLLLVFSTFM